MSSLDKSYLVLLEASQVSLNSIPINLRTMNEKAEMANGRWAMIGIISALGAYAVTGQIIPGIF